MPHRVKWEKQGAYWDISGVVRIDEIMEIINELIGSPKFDDLNYFILDATNVIELIATKHQLDAPAAIVKSTNDYKPKMKVGFVSEDEHIRALIAHYIEKSFKLGSTWERKIFNDIEDARTWVLLQSYWSGSGV
ncbi:MAG: hypothetical protein KZQ83_15310 [gamma proteobacterium symbiont of Taylorina sp.]|nr:hypothetical protein [gamma proteobacterium symbiont of Taylorina sp.]